MQHTFSERVLVLPSVENLLNITVCDQNDSSQDATFDLSHFVKYAARIDRNQTIVGDVIFNRTLIVDGNVTLTGTIDGVDLVHLYSQSVFMNGLQIVGGNLIITSNSTVVINGDIDVDLLNGVDFSELTDNTLRIDRDQVCIRGLLASFVCSIFETFYEVSL